MKEEKEDKDNNEVGWESLKRQSYRAGMAAIILPNPNNR